MKSQAWGVISKLSHDDDGDDDDALLRLGCSRLERFDW